MDKDARIAELETALESLLMLYKAEVKRANRAEEENVKLAGKLILGIAGR